jgi:phosphate transport system substrate-binding protein
MAELRPGTVELYALDGSAVIKGDLLEINHGSYVVRTALGTFRIGLDEAQCVGHACPLLDRFDADFAIASSTPELQSTMSALIASYASSLDADYRVSGADGTSSDVAIVDGGTSERLANIHLELASDSKAGATRKEGDGLSVFAETELAASAGADDLLTMGLEGVAVIAHPASPIAALSREELAGLFACAESELRLGDASVGPVRLYSRQTSSDSFRTFAATVLDPNGFGLCDRVTQLPTDADIAAAVARDIGSLGVVSLQHVHNAKPLSIAECGIAHQPDVFGAKTEEYPLTSRVLMEAPSLAQSSAAAQSFIDFALNDAGQRQLEEAGLIGLNPTSTSAYASRYRVSRIEAAAGAVQNTEVFGQLLEVLDDAVRLSITFRFDTGGPSISGQNGLDNRAQRDLLRLVDYLKTQAPEGTEVLLLGYADASGDYDGNLALSKARARSVAEKLIALGVTPDTITGFGEEGPVACNDDPAGRAKNRRVEVWLRLPDTTADQRLIQITM